MNHVTSGSLAGFVATVPMTAVMQLLHKYPVPEPERWPPRQIAERMGRRLGLTQELDHDERSALTWASHFGYGTSAGGLYGLLFGNTSVPPVTFGVGYGLAVWAASYLGWLPAAGIMRPATRQNRRRNVMLIASHAVWGGVLGLLTDRLRRA